MEEKGARGSLFDSSRRWLIGSNRVESEPGDVSGGRCARFAS